MAEQDGDCMARGKKYSDEIKEKAYTTYAVLGNFEDVARRLGVPATTVRTWIEARRRAKPDEFEELRRETHRGFIEKSTEIIDKGLDVLDMRLTAARDSMTYVQTLADFVTKHGDELTDGERRQIMGRLSALELSKISEITTAVGTLYDKRALAKGESTENTTIEIKLPPEADEYAG